MYSDQVNPVNMLVSYFILVYAIHILYVFFRLFSSLSHPDYMYKFLLFIMQIQTNHSTSPL